jgi:hypothetical protein
MTDHPGYMRIAKFCKWSDLSPPTVHRLCRKGKLRNVRIGGASDDRHGERARVVPLWLPKAGAGQGSFVKADGEALMQTWELEAMLGRLFKWLRRQNLDEQDTIRLLDCIRAYRLGRQLDDAWWKHLANAVGYEPTPKLKRKVRTCAACGRPLEASRTRAAVYCDDRCRHAAFAARQRWKRK